MRLTPESRWEALDPKPGRQVSERLKARTTDVWDLEQRAMSSGQDTLASGWTLFLVGQRSHLQENLAGDNPAI